MQKLKNIFGTASYPEEFVCGVEYEIEDIKKISDTIYNSCNWIIEEDNSLRNGGKEFKTTPKTFTHSLELFKQLHNHLKYGEQAFSDRTSIHVHVNVGEFDTEQAKNLVLLYALVEPLFFEFVGNGRKDNIYCVPLNYTYLPNYYNKPFTKLRDQWHKYTAFNILPVNTLGTVEFRHMYGTNNLETFTKWLESIKALHDCAFFDNFNALQFISKATSKELINFTRQLLPHMSTLSNYEAENLLYDSVLDVKLASGGIA